MAHIGKTCPLAREILSDDWITRAFVSSLMSHTERTVRRWGLYGESRSLRKEAFGGVSYLEPFPFLLCLLPTMVSASSSVRS